MASEPSERAMKAAGNAAAMRLDAQQALREILGVDGMQEFHEQIAHALDDFTAEAMREERERCAQFVADSTAICGDPLREDQMAALAAAIRGQDDE